ncbi:hypothetical protein [Streptomyces sp. JW3]|uniref:hypothetical protein n=1 Tax=Streptomyces sp. JW3 TaxID=3456955 RepID=UPI003FA41C11
MERRSARRTDGADEETDAALDALYTTPPPHFVTRRTELAAEAGKTGRGEGVRLIKAARRPTLAAWAANLLLRSRPQESAKLLELGRALREAYRTLDAAELKSLAAQRRLVAALTRQAADLADAAGYPLSGAVRREVESTLGAVLADQEAADRWATGRLHTALTPPSAFPSGEAAAPAPERPPAKRKRVSRGEGTEGRRRTGDRTADRRDKAGATAENQSGELDELDELAERRRVRQERLTRAREAAEAAARQLSAARTEATAADAGLEGARQLREEAREQVSAAEQRLTEARAEARRAGREQREAEERHRAAAHALTTAERAARETDRALRRLDPRGG